MPSVITVKPRARSCSWSTPICGAVGHHDALVEDGPPHHRAPPDHGVLHDHRRLHACSLQRLRTPGDSTEWSTTAPAITQPDDTIDSWASPPSTNLAPGSCGWCVMIGHSPVVEVEHRVDRHQVEVGVVVRVDRADVAPVAAVAVGATRARRCRGSPTRGPRPAFTSGGHDVAAHVVDRRLVGGVGPQGVDQHVAW